MECINIMRDIRSRVKIPTNDFVFSEVEYKLSDEKLVVFRNDKVIYSPMHLFNSVDGAISNCYLREGTVEKLNKAAESLPNGYYLKIYDAWRPLLLQEELYKKSMERFEDLEMLIYMPLRDERKGPVHTTGGSVDITIVNEKGIELNMGTKFGDYSEKSHTDYFEIRYPADIEIVKNRRLLYNIMTDAGFTNMPTKWWHYDYGNKFWAYYTKEPAKYGCEFG